LRNGLRRGPKVLQAIADGETCNKDTAYLKENIKPQPVTDAQIKVRAESLAFAMGHSAPCVAS
jgi:hypothetical protein